MAMKKKPNRGYHNNDLSFPCLKKDNNYTVDYLSRTNSKRCRYRQKNMNTSINELHTR